MKLSIITVPIFFDVWCWFRMNRPFCFNVFNYQEVYGALLRCVCVCNIKKRVCV